MVPSISHLNEANIILQNGDTLTLKDFRGNEPLVLNIWSTSCRACLLENPSLDRASEILKSNKIKLLALSRDQINKQIKYLNKNEFSFPVAEIVEKNILSNTSLPTTYLINSKGETVQVLVGSREWDTKEIMGLLLKSLKD